MMNRRKRGAALVEYAFLLLCVVGFAGAGVKGIHAKTSRTAQTAMSTISETGGGGGGAGGGTSGGGAAPVMASGRGTTGAGSTAGAKTTTGTDNKPAPGKKGPKKIEKKPDPNASDDPS